jgi:large subunit ribosomal protein L21e
MKKANRTAGKISLSRYFQPYKDGDLVVLVGEPAVQRAMFHPRYWGCRGTVVGKRGRCYEIMISDQGLAKMFVVHPIHLRKA